MYESASQYINYDSKHTRINWIEKFGLYCNHSFEIGLFGSVFFVGYVATCMFVPYLAEKYGRKKFVILSIWM